MRNYQFHTDIYDDTVMRLKQMSGKDGFHFSIKGQVKNSF